VTRAGDRGRRRAVDTAGDRAATRPRLAPEVLAAAAAVWLVGLLGALVASTPYQSDDGLNTAVRDDPTPLATLVLRYTHQWMVNEGRFFPGSLAWSYSVFRYTGTLLEYKLVLVGLIAAAVLVVALLVRRLAGRGRAGLVATVVVVGFLQLRGDLDGLLAFAGLLPLTTALALGATLLLCTRRGWPWAVLAAVTYGVALVTYETVLLFLPALVMVVVAVRRSWRPALALVVPAAVQVAVVVVLRARLVHETAPGYTLGLDPVAVLRTFAVQLLGAVPLSAVLVGRPAGVAFTASMVVIAVVLAGVPTFLALRRLGPVGPVVDRGPGLLALLGAWMWVSSAGLVAVTVRWQETLRPGGAYVPVVYGYVGAALVLLAAGLRIESWARARGGVAVVAWSFVAPGAVAALVTATVAGNLAVAAAL
jgi:hypothetical protein